MGSNAVRVRRLSRRGVARWFLERLRRRPGVSCIRRNLDEEKAVTFFEKKVTKKTFVSPGF
jgi:hypothetical protein